MSDDINDYEILQVTSLNGGAVSQSIDWDINKASDIKVLIDINGEVYEDGSAFYSDGEVFIPSKEAQFTAYIMRAEVAEYIISESADGRISLDSILSQLKKNIRVLEQLEANDKYTLKCLGENEIQPIPKNRNGKILSFDNSGNPICKIATDDLENIATQVALIQQSERNAKTSEQNAKTSEQNAKTSELNAKTSEQNAKTLLDNAVKITDPDGFRTKTSEDISSLFTSKANNGALHFYGGLIQCSGLANKPIPNVNSIAFRWKIDNNTYNKIATSQRVFGYSASGGLSWYHLAKVSGGALQWYVKYEDNSQQFVAVTTATWESLIDGNWHNVEFISTGTAFEIWVDGVLKQSTAKNKTANIATPASNFLVSYGTSNIGEVADFCFFNFDMSAGNAPYTIEDYQNGRAIPPSILDGTQTILALENYTITNGTTKVVFDYSGNNNDATVIGDVKGDNDKRITKLIDFIKA